MKKLSIYAGLMAFSAMSASAIYAAPDGRADQDGNRIITKAEAMAAADAHFAMMDANADGTLNDSDKTAMLAKRFAAIDTDKNGSISQAEFMAAHEMRDEHRADRREKRMEHGKMGKRHEHEGGRDGRMDIMARVDSNGDKAISQTEFRAAAEARFAKADANKDGSISPDERKAGRKGGWNEPMAPAQPNGG
ncbi:Ca2+-binding EF-hand superfamily protein [Sphingorhabdus rigui]|uniref:Ca2+-binding EF-hand superfamily protein n=1 Tax=Sphingorhabdus rigui TaxID=1282858 RepID=A0A840B3Q5_9SPHN|nr:EF-hand domain-containing protein [Sphingorhabdus rigui]MBB3943184.1 Ca2+-binding EF-hand superfamily protein [Sphingorhabdus rigui]